MGAAVLVMCDPAALLFVVVRCCFFLSSNRCQGVDHVATLLPHQMMHDLPHFAGPHVGRECQAAKFAVGRNGHVA